MSEIVTQAVIILSIALVAWYFIGAQINRRRISRLLTWLKEGLRILGGETTIRWLGTSGFQVRVKGPKHPFKKMEMTFLLEPREMLLLWLFYLLKGRRDLLVIKSDLRSIPKTEVEILQKRNRMTRKILKALDEKTWVRGEVKGTNLIVAKKGKDVAGLIERLPSIFKEQTPYILRLSLRKRSPHLLVNLSLPGMEVINSGVIFTLLEEMVKALSRMVVTT
jgi:hypothetical protein